MELKHENLVNIIDKTKAILVGRDIVIDGFAKRKIRIITHAHSDHVCGLRDSIYYSEYLIATPATHDLLVELGYVKKKYLHIYQRKKLALDYHVEKTFYDHGIEFLRATHIFGSAQVKISYNGYIIGYTSDFKMGNDTEIINSPDILIIEATYGSPTCRRPFKNDVVDLIVDLVFEGLRKYDKVTIYGYHGKLQEIMKILREKGVKEPFLMNKKIYSITKIVEKYGWKIGNYYSINNKDAYEIIQSKKYLFFEHMVKAKHRKLNGSVLNIVLTGHEHREPIRKIDEYTWVAAFSDHADFDELIEYVELSQPKLIVIDGSREGYPYTFAKELRRKGWNTIVLPEKK